MEEAFLQDKEFYQSMSQAMLKKRAEELPPAFKAHRVVKRKEQREQNKLDKKRLKLDEIKAKRAAAAVEATVEKKVKEAKDRAIKDRAIK